MVWGGKLNSGGGDPGAQLWRWFSCITRARGQAADLAVEWRVRRGGGVEE